MYAWMDVNVVCMYVCICLCKNECMYACILLFICAKPLNAVFVTQTSVSLGALNHTRLPLVL